MTKNKNEKQFYINKVNKNTDWNQYINELHAYLTGLGFKKYNQNYKQEDFSYWKVYDDKYQIGLLVYDFTKYNQHNLNSKVSIQFECMLVDINCRCDLSVSKNTEIDEFEQMAKSFYESMIKYCQ